MLNVTQNNRIQYILDSVDLGRLITNDNLNYREDTPTFKRTKEHGFTTEYDTDLVLIDEGREYVNNAINSFGANYVITVEKQRRHPHKDYWLTEYKAEIDLSTAVDEGNKLTLKLKKGGAEKVLETRLSEKVELNTTESIDGEALEPLTPIKMRLDARSLNLVSLFANKFSPNAVRVTADNPKGNGGVSSASQVFAYMPIPLVLLGGGIAEAQTPITTTQNLNRETISVGSFIFYNAEEDKTINLDVNGTILDLTQSGNELVNSFFFIRVYSGGNNPVLKSLLLRIELTKDLVNNGRKNINFNEDIDLSKGDSISIGVIYSSIFYSGKISYTTNLKANISETKSFPSTLHDGYLLPNLLDRLLKINDVKSRLVSNYLSLDNIASNMVVTHGMAIRNFTEADQLYKPFTTSLKDALSSINAILNVGYAIEQVNGNEAFVIEEKDYFFNNTLVGSFGKVSNVKREVAEEFYYTAIETGYKDGGNYEEDTGLNEFNIKSNYATDIKIKENKLDLLSEFRADSIGVELTRIEQRDDNPTADNSRDEDIFIFSCKRLSTDFYTPKKASDLYSDLPTGIFSPETAYNYDISPVSNLLRHRDEIFSAMRYSQRGILKYTSSNTAPSLVTEDYKEKSDLPTNLFNSSIIPQRITFEVDLSFEQLEKLKGQTIIKGGKVVNLYGRWSFDAGNGLESGWLLSVKVGNKSEVVILKSI